MQTEEAKTFNFNGVDYPCIAGDSNTALELGFGGYAPSADRVLVVLLSAFGGDTPMAEQDTFGIDDKILNVASLVKSPDGQFIVYTCNDPSKGV